MNKYLRRIFTLAGSIFVFTGNIIQSFSKKLYQSENEKLNLIFCNNLLKWTKDNGDRIHRLFYKLNQSSIVFDLGGYEGKWSSDIYSMYQCNIYIFDIIPEYFKYLQKKYKNNKKISVFGYGLGEDNKYIEVSVNNDSTSQFRSFGNIVPCRLVKAEDFIHKHGIKHIDLMKINIEGGEYELLEYLISSGIVKMIDNLQVQFHTFIQDFDKKINKIHKNLSSTHVITYNYKYVWTNWKRK